jgi:hypothetical protein
MTTGECIIDGTDIATLGMFIEPDGSNDLLAFPERRLPDTNDWAEEDGIDADLTDIFFDAKKVVINYVMLADDFSSFQQRIKAFESLHTIPGMRQIYIGEYATTFILRFVSFKDYRHKGGYYKPSQKRAAIAVEYAMDDPLQLYTTAISSPVGDPVSNQYVKVNGRDLSAYGIIVKEIYSSALKPRSIKDVLVRKIHIVSGQEADTEMLETHRKSREIEIDCAMMAATRNELLINMTALFNEFRKSTPIQLMIAYESLYCYYMKTSQFSKPFPFSRKVRVDFTLHLQEISWAELVRLLATLGRGRMKTISGYYLKLK